jgi:hypothetical protein
LRTVRKVRSVRMKKVEQTKDSGKKTQSSCGIIGEILDINRNPQARSVRIVKKVIGYHVGLRLVAVLAEIIEDGLYWKMEKNNCGRSYTLTVVGHMKKTMVISPMFLEYISSFNFTYEDVDNFTAIGEREGMAWYGKWQFDSEDKIQEYIDNRKNREKADKIAAENIKAVNKTAMES